MTPAPTALLAGRTILVTGADGTGVGAGVCAAVVEAGGRVVVHGRTQAGADRAASQWPGSIAVHGDVADEDDVEAFVRAAVGEAGRLDGVVNNAGVGLNRSFVDTAAADFDHLYAVDVRGTWLTTRAFVRAALRTGHDQGAIVNVSSVHATATMAGYALYAGAKAAVNGLTRGMAIELGSLGIRCNAIAPGYVHSEQNLGLLAGLTPDPRAWVAAHTEDQQAIASLVGRDDCGRWAAFLLSPAAAGTTGQVVTVDNGTTALLYNRTFTSYRGPG